MYNVEYHQQQVTLNQPQVRQHQQNVRQTQQLSTQTLVPRRTNLIQVRSNQQKFRPNSQPLNFPTQPHRRQTQLYRLPNPKPATTNQMLIDRSDNPDELFDKRQVKHYQPIHFAGTRPGHHKYQTVIHPQTRVYQTTNTNKRPHLTTIPIHIPAEILTKDHT